MARPTLLEELGIVSDSAKCRQRNRLAALRYGVETAQLDKAIEVGVKPDFVRGYVPGPDRPEEALALINALRPDDAPPIGLNDIYILPVMQSANSSFAKDRPMRLGASTLKNIQREASAGFAFMNNHRTGGVSEPAELPFGRTYAGRFERFQDTVRGIPFHRVLLGSWMPKGVHPNGSSGPSSDDLYRMIVTGTMPDVSMGVYGHRPVCDICGRDVDDKECKHVPATDKEMSAEEKRRQKALGRDDGTATYTVEDGHAYEVSGVFDGAIPGAGFSKAVGFARAGMLSYEQLAQMARAYERLIGKGDLGMDIEELLHPKPNLLQRIYNGFSGHGITVRSDGTLALADVPNADEADSSPDTDATPVRTPPETGPSVVDTPEAPSTPAGTAIGSPAPHNPPDTQPAAPTQLLTRVTEQERLIAEQKAYIERIEAEKVEKLATEVASTLISDKQLLPAGRPKAIALAKLLSNVGAPIPAQVEFQNNLGQTFLVTPTELLKAVFEDVPQHELLTERLPGELPAGAALVRGSVDTEDQKVAQMKAEAREDARSVRPKKKGGKAAQNGHGEPK